MYQVRLQIPLISDFFAARTQSDAAIVISEFLNEYPSLELVLELILTSTASSQLAYFSISDLDFTAPNQFESYGRVITSTWLDGGVSGVLDITYEAAFTVGGQTRLSDLDTQTDYILTIGEVADVPDPDPTDPTDPTDPEPTDPDPTDPDPTDPDPTDPDPDPTDPDPTDPEEPPMPTPTPVYGFGLVFSVAVAAALRAQLDEQVGFQKSISNVIVNGVTGISQPVTWDLEDPDTDAGYLNSQEVTTLIQNQGLRFWGNRNCSEDPRFSFEVATRTAQIVLETIVQGCAIFADQPLIPQLAKDIIDSIQAKLDEFTAAGQLIGASVWYDPAENSTEALSQGQFWVDYDYTPVPTLENLGLNQRITDRYLVDFAKLIAQAA